MGWQPRLPVVGQQPLWLLLTCASIIGVTLAFAAMSARACISSPTQAGGDFRVFYAAGLVLRSSGDPYHNAALRIAMQGLNAPGGTTGVGQFVYLPWFAMVMVPFSFLPFFPALILWTVLEVGAVAISTAKWAATVGWPHSMALAPLATISGVAVFNYFLGQVAAFELAILVAVVVSLVKHRIATAAGLAVVAAFLKPQDLWPLVPLVWVGASCARRIPVARVLSAQAATAVALLGIPLLVSPSLFSHWLHAIVTFAQNLKSQPQLAGLPGMLGYLPSRLHLYPSFADPLVLGIVVAGFTIGSVGLWYGMHHDRFRSLPASRQVAWVMLLPTATWLLVTPYAHTEDLITLFPLAALAAWPQRSGLDAAWRLSLAVAIGWVPVALWTLGESVFVPASLAPLTTLMVVAASVRRFGMELRSAEPPARLATPALVRLRE